MSYPHIERPGAPLTQLPERVSPLKLSGSFSNYLLLDSELSHWYKNQKILNPCRFNESSARLLPGILNLINLLIERHAQNETIETLVFLDKSARLAYHLCRVAVTESAKLALSRNNDFSGFKKPQILFITPEINPPQTVDALISLKNRYRQQNLSGRVMILDEFMVTGDTARRATKLLELGEYAPTHVEALGVFGAPPMWYSHNSIKGVTDSSDTSVLNQSFVINLQPQKRALLLGGIKKFGWEQFVQLVLEEKTKQQTQGKTGNGIELLSDLLPSDVDPDQVVRYLASEEGALALRPRRIDARATDAYRQTLGTMMREVFRRKLVEFWP